MTIRLTKTLVAVLVTAAMVGLGGVASAQSVLERAKKDGYIRVGFPNQVPYAFATEKGVLTGADTEVARKVVQRMGIKEMDGVLTEFASLIPGLKAGRFDIVLAMFVNPARCQQVAFSEPIYGIGQGLIVRKDNPKKIQSWDDLIKRADVSLAIMAGAVQGIYAQKLGIPEGRVASYPDGPSAINAVKTGRSDVFGISALSARKMIENAGPDAGVALVAGFKDPVVDGKPARGYGAFAFRKEDSDLQAEFNKALAGLLGTKEHLEAIKQFGFEEDNLPDAKTADLCK